MNSTTQTQHTPGPWHMGAGNGSGSIFADEGRTRLEEGGTTLYPIATINHAFGDEDEANARLIAAAPDLLAALEAADEVLAHEGYQGSQPVRVSIRSALARARAACNIPHRTGTKNMKDNSQSVTFRIAPDLKARLQAAASAQGLTFTGWLMQAAREKLIRDAADDAALAGSRADGKAKAAQ